MKAKKSLGQHFLKSPKVLEKIIEVSDINPLDIILEIGPGEGVMTTELLKWSGKVIVVEKDKRLIPYLEEKFKKEISENKLDILEKDILEFDLSLLNSYKHTYKVIANIPYYITGQIIRKFLESENQPESMTLLVQREVAERIVAKDKKESLLSISVKIFGDPKYIKTVPPGAFTPSPSVDSAILTIENISKDKLKNIDEKKFWEILHLGFGHKRKQLLSNLSSEYNRDLLLEVFKKSDLEPKVRAEDVNLEKWIELCNNLSIEVK